MKLAIVSAFGAGAADDCAGSAAANATGTIHAADVVRMAMAYREAPSAPNARAESAPWPREIRCGTICP